MSEAPDDSAADGIEEGKRLIRLGGTNGLSLAEKLTERFHRATNRFMDQYRRRVPPAQQGPGGGGGGRRKELQTR